MIEKALGELLELSPEELIAGRYEKFRALGAVLEG